jgi:hypothetical protein
VAKAAPQTDGNLRKLRIEKVMPLTHTRAAEEAAGTEDLA